MNIIAMKVYNPRATHHNAFVSIDYDEDISSSYRGICVTMGAEEIARFHGGGPDKDWANYLRWKENQTFLILETSSLTHFFWDVPGWRMVLNEAGQEIIVEDEEDER